MYCSHCGSQLDKGATFCPVCKQRLYVNRSGAQPQHRPAYAAPSQPAYGQSPYQMQKNDIRQSEMSALNRAIQHFAQKKQEFDEYDEVCRQVESHAEGSSRALIIWGGIIATFGFILLLILLSGDFSAMVPALLFFFGGGGMIAGGIVKVVNHNQDKTRYEQRYAQLSYELYHHYLACPDCPVGPEYVNPAILMTLLTYLQSGRADTVKESLNLAIGKAGRGVSGYLMQMAKYTMDINAQTGVPAIFVAARFFR